MDSIHPRAVATTVRALVLPALVAGTVLAGVVPGAARQAGPGSPPDPTACAVPARPIEFFAEFVGPSTGEGPSAEVAAGPNPYLPRQGDPADAATVDGVTATMREVFACYNAGSPRRTFALFNDGFLRRLAADDPIAPAAFAFFAAPPAPVPVADRQGVTVREIRLLPDGRVGAVVEGHYPHGRWPGYTVFILEGGRWLVDDVLPLPVAATPAP